MTVFKFPSRVTPGTLLLLFITSTWYVEKTETSEGLFAVRYHTSTNRDWIWDFWIARTHVHTRDILNFFFPIPFTIFALLFSLPPGRNSDLGSHSRLFSPPTHYGSCLTMYIFQGIYIYVSHTHSLVYSSSREYLILRWMLWVRFLAFVPCFLLFLFSPALSPYVIFIVFLRLCSSSSHLLMYSQQVRIYVIVRVLSTCCVICILPHLGIPLCFIRAKRVSNWYIPKKKSARVPVCPCARVK